MIPRFYQKTPAERRTLLGDSEGILRLAGPLNDETAFLDRMSENVIGAWRLPLGVLTGLAVNGTEHRVAMATEEPSVVAAANRAARVCNAAGGVSCTVDTPVTEAQILCVVHKDSAADLTARIRDELPSYLDAANAVNPGLCDVGGGAFELAVSVLELSGLDAAIELRLFVHTVDAMGANAVNTMAEAVQALVAQRFADWPGYRRGMAIITNAAPGRFVHASVAIPLDTLAQFSPHADLADRIEMASRLAMASPERAVTHNKGILNGIVAAALPLGQDTRALVSAFYAAACAKGPMRPMVRWEVRDAALCGTADMPLVVGFAGGFRRNPAVQAAFAFDAISSYDSLCAVLAAVGIAQNLSALWALVSDGIQAGHMALHARKTAPT